MEAQNDNHLRQPKDLDGLLKFCMHTTKSEDAPDSNGTRDHIEPERLQWLQEAIKSMTVDVVQLLLEGLQILSRPCIYDVNATAHQIEEAEEAFEAILDWIGSIDMANNFHKIGGFDILMKCLKQSPHSVIRRNAANIVAELSQNNPHCQENLVQQGFIQALIDQLAKGVENDEILDENCSLKFIYAISSIVRSCPSGLSRFLSLNGPEKILKFVIQPKSQSKRLQTKTCFFISSICDESNAVVKAFSDVGLARHLLPLLEQKEHQQSDEHIVKALLILLKEDCFAQQKFRKSPELNIKSLIDTRKENLIGKPESLEELDYYIQIENLCCGLSLY